MELLKEERKNDVTFKMNHSVDFGSTYRKISIQAQDAVYSGVADHRNDFRSPRIRNHVSGSYGFVVV